MQVIIKKNFYKKKKESEILFYQKTKMRRAAKIKMKRLWLTGIEETKKSGIEKRYGDG